MDQARLNKRIQDRRGISKKNERGNRKVKNNRLMENKEKLKSTAWSKTQKWWEDTGIREKRKWERKSNDSRLVLKDRFMRKKYIYIYKYLKKYYYSKIIQQIKI